MSQRPGKASSKADKNGSNGAPHSPLAKPSDVSGGAGGVAFSRKDSSIEKKIDEAVVYEFGGPIGVTCMMVFFPMMMFYFWICLEYNRGYLLNPLAWSTWQHLPAAAPTRYSFQIYGGFVVLQLVLAYFVPGPWFDGLPLPSLGGKSLKYLCNGVGAWYITLALAFVLHMTGLFPLTEIVDHFGPIMTTGIIFGVTVSILTYVITVTTPLFGKPHRMSGNVMYDIFMGAPLNPRIGHLDLKMWVEIRIPWILIFFVAVSAALKQRQLEGQASVPALFMVLAHLLYTNACMKGEECIPTTWDIFYEKWGFMLIFWNFAGVPFTYCLSTMFILKNGGATFTEGPLFYVFCFTLLLVGYYVWDTANSQKNRFRSMDAGIYKPRKWAFPQLPWGTLYNPEYILTKQGSKLLVSGWWAYARKIHYTADLCMALSWGLITGLRGLLPYFYVTFFCTVLVHRVSRDVERCAHKYGEDWKRYCQKVPYIFIPGVY